MKPATAYNLHGSALPLMDNDPSLDDAIMYRSPGTIPIPLRSNLVLGALRTKCVPRSEAPKDSVHIKSLHALPSLKNLFPFPFSCVFAGDVVFYLPLYAPITTSAPNSIRASPLPKNDDTSPATRSRLFSDPCSSRLDQPALRKRNTGTWKTRRRL